MDTVIRTLFDIVTSAERNQANKRPDFSGRLCTPSGQIAKLYPEFGNKDKEVGPASSKEDTSTIKLDSSTIRS